MRTYAKLYNSHSEMWTVIFQDEDDYESGTWYTLHEDMQEEVANAILRGMEKS